MLKLIIEDDEGRKTVVPFVRDEITIGRQEGNTIRLTERNVSRRHARLMRVNGHVLVEDLDSYNGIRVNGERIKGKSEVQDGDLIQIGDYDLAIQHEESLSASQIDTAVAPPPPPNGTHDTSSQTETEVEPVSGDHLAEVTGAELVETPAGGEPFPPARRVPTSLIRVQNFDDSSPARVEEIPPEEAPRLVVVNTELSGREFACIRSELTLGRAEDNDIAVDHRSLSRTHAKLRRDGEGVWRIFDLQSANGLTVNGDVYAQAILKHGDEIELGHVRFKFVGAGQSFHLEPTALMSRRRRVRWPLVAGGVVVLGLVAFVGYREATSPGFLSGLWALMSGDVPSSSGPAVPGELPTQSVVVAARGAPEAAAPAGLPDAPEVRAALDRASDAIASKNMERAVTVLGTLLQKKDLHPTRRDEASELLNRAKAEIEARRSLTLAKQHLGAGRLDDAERLLDSADGTHAYAQELAELRTDLESALATRKPKVAAATVATSRAPAAASASAAPKDVDRLFKDGTDHFVKKQYREAANAYTRCLEVNPDFARCHMMLGSTYARLGQAERGAEHYRRFVKLAPNDGEAAKVRILLEEYEKTKRRTGSADGSQ